MKTGRKSKKGAGGKSTAPKKRPRQVDSSNDKETLAQMERFNRRSRRDFIKFVAQVEGETIRNFEEGLKRIR